MTDPNGPSAGVPPILSVATLRWMAALLLACKVVLWLSAGPFMDETYYWIWGQHPALSYFDHPPLSAWLQGVSAQIFGWNTLGLRVMVMLSVVGDVAFLYLFARKLAPERSEQYFWLSLVLFLSTPIFFSMTGPALPDHMLILCSLGSCYFFYSFFDKWRADAPASYGALYLGALFLGLAVLSKYNGAFLGLGVALFIVISRRYRPLLKQPQLYLAAAISLVLQTPVIVWNVSERFASYDFILQGRHQGISSASVGVVGFFLGAIVFLSPFLLPLVMRFIRAPWKKSEQRPLGFEHLVFLVSTVTMFVVSFFTTVLFHWNLVAYVAMLPFLALYLRSKRLVIAQAVFGGLFLLGTIFNYAVLPVMSVFANGDEASSWVYDWNAVATHVQTAEQSHPAQFIAGSDYTVASLLAFALKDKDVTSLSQATDEYDYWFNSAAHAGQNAIVVADSWRNLTPYMSSRFKTLTLVETVPILRFGKLLNSVQIYYGEGFQGN
ncbi:MAG: Dolichyl-phosphate-mannose-protein mannosyltransferase [Hyphomicrobiales bacterium]|nr:Dolichyl-phosphate-mannose-protein mannosyltransferase [Hyphomicrobiales bacterium]